ncbi:response regulator transcription factor [Noviherbaspirillum sp.]|uniref:response regulator transcription factor n=1 Tax=Noviherbaspirillum sp. TaxID=1926288 RepID=UPI002B47F40F|nr:response regulator [Noviherbaspirillum sp.]HJV80032.1 response regulator [Noviherbaspirillum sp.]
MRKRTKALNIIIADDDATTCHVLRMLLREHGHQVVGEARDGEKAIELCEMHKPDLAFIDIAMPRMDGHQATQAIRQKLPNVGVIMISALPTLENVQTALQAGASGFVVKPFNAIKVVDAIENCLKQKQVQKQG